MEDASVYPEVMCRLLAKLREIHAEVNGPYSKSAHFIDPNMPIPKPEKSAKAERPPKSD
jgi:hypothetical protein